MECLLKTDGVTIMIRNLELMSSRGRIFLFATAPYLDWHGPGLPGNGYAGMSIAGAFGRRKVQGVSLHGYLQDRNRRGALRRPRCASLQFAVNRAVCMATPSRHGPRGRFLFRAGGVASEPKTCSAPRPYPTAGASCVPCIPSGKRANFLPGGQANFNYLTLDFCRLNSLTCKRPARESPRKNHRLTL